MGNDRHVANICRLVHERTDLFDCEAVEFIVSARGSRCILTNAPLKTGRASVEWEGAFALFYRSVKGGMEARRCLT